MKRILHLPLIIMLASAGTIKAEPERAPEGPQSFGSMEDTPELPEFLKLYDLDGDNRLSVEEREVLRADRNRGAKLRERWDTDKDGVISASEREAAQARIRMEIEQQRKRRFAEVDIDQDGSLDFEEFAAIPAVQEAEVATAGNAARLFDHLDRDKDGRISEAEFLAALDRPEQPRPRDDGDDDTR